MIHASLDDSTGEILGFAMEQLLDAGALDVSFIPLYMKKNRPGVKLEVICNRSDEKKLLEIIFRETTTLGVRITEARRAVMTRELRKVHTPFGPVRVKRAHWQGVVKASPEYEDCRQAALRAGVSLQTVYQSALTRTDIEGEMTE
ncbi:nickel insertion protein [Anoxynatronum sibiricum]|uniref:Nickel insertion protein n=1 Tax=Anoxynatronum sibiricum TaxID=210623 RepID=A0ABU9VP58_9CLOT